MGDITLNPGLLRSASGLVINFDGEAFFPGEDRFFEEMGASASLGKTFALGHTQLELGLVGEANTFSNNAGVYFNANFPLSHRLGLQLGLEGGVAFANGLSISQVSNPDFTAWQARQSRYQEYLTRRDQVQALNNVRTRNGLSASPLPDPVAPAGSAPEVTRSILQEQTDYGAYVAAGAHFGWVAIPSADGERSLLGFTLDAHAHLYLFPDPHLNRGARENSQASHTMLDLHLMAVAETQPFRGLEIFSDCGLHVDFGEPAFRCAMGIAGRFNIVPGDDGHGHGSSETEPDHHNHEHQD